MRAGRFREPTSAYDPVVSSPGTSRRRLAGLLALLAATLGGSLWIAGRSEPATVPAVALEGELDLGHGVRVRRVELGERPVPYVVVTIPRRKGLAMRAVLVDRGLRPLGEIAASAGAIAAVNGDYHEMRGFLLGKTYSTLVEGGDPRDLARYRVAGRPDPGDASFWLDEARVPRISPLDLEASIGLPADVEQGLHHSRSAANLVTAPTPGSTPLERAWAFPVDPVREGFRISGPAARRLDGPSLVVREDAVARLATAVAPGAVLALSVRKRVDLAIGTGPWLLASGEIPRRVPEGDEAWSRYPRTAVGLNADTIFLVATIHAAHQRVSMLELARALLALGCTDALNLDGGPSTSLWARGRLLNVSPDLAGLVDPVGSALCVLPGVEGRDDVR